MSHGFIKSANATPRERALHELLLSLQFGSIKFMPPDEDGSFGKPFTTHIATYEDPKVGDLVWGACGEIGILLQHNPDSYDKEYLIQRLGTEDTCWWGNERFYKVVNFNKDIILTPIQLHFKDELILAISKKGEYLHRFGGVEFDGDTAKVAIRKIFASKNDKPYYLQVDHISRFKNKTYRAVANELYRLGYGDDSMWPVDDKSNSC